MHRAVLQLIFIRFIKGSNAGSLNGRPDAAYAINIRTVDLQEWVMSIVPIAAKRTYVCEIDRLAH